MSEPYKAIEVRKPGEFAEVRRPLQDPGHDQVRIRVEACGVCHSDAATVEGSFPGITYPRVPGHEVVGRIDAVGSGVRGWQVGQRVGVGFLAGSCGYCEFCRGGDLVNCQNQENTGIHHDCGCAEVLLAKATGVVSIPDDLSSVDAAPLLCAGPTTFGALRNAPAKAGASAASPVWVITTASPASACLTHAKSMLISPPDVAIKHLFPPFSPEKNADLKIWSEY
jgi:alcohol dehydrogenase, propanol-preferring